MGEIRTIRCRWHGFYFINWDSTSNNFRTTAFSCRPPPKKHKTHFFWCQTKFYLPLTSADWSTWECVRLEWWSRERDSLGGVDGSCSHLLDDFSCSWSARHGSSVNSPWHTLMSQANWPSAPLCPANYTFTSEMEKINLVHVYVC